MREVQEEVPLQLLHPPNYSPAILARDFGGFFLGWFILGKARCFGLVDERLARRDAVWTGVSTL